MLPRYGTSQLKTASVYTALFSLKYLYRDIMMPTGHLVLSVVTGTSTEFPIMPVSLSSGLPAHPCSVLHLLLSFTPKFLCCRQAARSRADDINVV